MEEVDIFANDEQEEIKQPEQEMVSDDDIFNELANIQAEGKEAPTEEEVLNDIFAFSLGQDRFEIDGKHAPKELREKLLEFVQASNSPYNERLERYNNLISMREEDVYLRGRAMWLGQNMDRLEKFMDTDRFASMLNDDKYRAQVKAIYSDMAEMKREYGAIMGRMQSYQENLQSQESVRRNELSNSAKMMIEKRIPNFEKSHLPGVVNYLKKYADSDEEVTNEELSMHVMSNPVLAELAFKASRYDSIISARRKPKTTKKGGSNVTNIRQVSDDSEEIVDKKALFDRLESVGLI